MIKTDDGYSRDLNELLRSQLGSSASVKKILWGAAILLGAQLTWKLLTGKRRPEQATNFNSFLKQDLHTKPTKKAHTTDKHSFNAFLKVDKPVTSPTDFNAFLKQQNVDSDNLSSQPESQEEDLPDDGQVVITVLFGTEYGFAKEIAEKLCELLRNHDKFWPRLLDMADGPSQCDLSKEQVVLTVCSTQGDGVAPSEAREFCDWLQSSEAPSLQNTQFSVCALGDNSYTHFCACGKAIDSRLAQLGAVQLHARQDVNREDWKAVDQWLDSVVKAVTNLDLKTVSELGGYDIGSKEGQQKIGKNRPYFAKVVRVDGLCNIKSSDDKDTIRAELDLGDSGLEYEPGDALGIHASNAPPVVNDLLELLDADAESLHDIPSWHYKDERLAESSKITLFELLTYCYDLRWPRRAILDSLQAAMPSQEQKIEGPNKPSEKTGNNKIANGHSTMANGHSHTNGISPDLPEGSENVPQQNGHSSHKPPDVKDASPETTAKMTYSEQVSQLANLCVSSSEDLEKYFEPRHVIDILRDFDCASLTLDQLLKCLHSLQPRLYSISSSPLEKPNSVQVTIAVVRYVSLKEERMGVASTLLAERIQPGDRLPVYISKNPDFRLPHDSQTPIVMIGPGTGLAPFRSFMLQRILSQKSFGKSILFFGCRRRDQDYLYGNDLEKWARAGHMELFTAFSREQKKKVYVQNRVSEEGEKVWDLLEAGGHFYVCGDASSMAGAVEESLLQIIEGHQEGGPTGARQYLQTLQSQGRYQRDVWY